MAELPAFRPSPSAYPQLIPQLHRVLRAAPEKVYRAFLDADAMAKWLPPNGFTGKVRHLEAKVGGTHKLSFTNFATGQSHSFDGKCLELAPDEGIRYTDKFDDPNLPEELPVTVTFNRKGCPRPSRPRLAISAGRNRSRLWPSRSKSIFQINARQK
jgi:uncharacterized protein YndB with AHSA1/START domain